MNAQIVMKCNRRFKICTLHIFNSFINFQKKKQQQTPEKQTNPKTTFYRNENNVKALTGRDPEHADRKLTPFKKVTLLNITIIKET